MIMIFPWLAIGLGMYWDVSLQDLLIAGAMFQVVIVGALTKKTTVFMEGVGLVMTVVAARVMVPFLTEGIVGIPQEIQRGIEALTYAVAILTLASVTVIGIVGGKETKGSHETVR